MPYHLRQRDAAYCHCGKAATHELRNERNAVIDWCCLKCGARRVLRKAEAAEKVPPPMVA